MDRHHFTEKPVLGPLGAISVVQSYEVSALTLLLLCSALNSQVLRTPESKLAEISQSEQYLDLPAFKVVEDGLQSTRIQDKKAALEFLIRYNDDLKMNMGLTTFVSSKNFYNQERYDKTLVPLIARVVNEHKELSELAVRTLCSISWTYRTPFDLQGPCRPRYTLYAPLTTLEDLARTSQHVSNLLRKQLSSNDPTIVFNSLSAMSENQRLQNQDLIRNLISSNSEMLKLASMEYFRAKDDDDLVAYIDNAYKYKHLIIASATDTDFESYGVFRREVRNLNYLSSHWSKLSSEIRSYLIDALSDRKQDGWKAVAKSGLQDSDYRVRLEAIQALRHHDPSKMFIFNEYYFDSSPEIRAAAILDNLKSNDSYICAKQNIYSENVKLLSACIDRLGKDLTLDQIEWAIKQGVELWELSDRIIELPKAIIIKWAESDNDRLKDAASLWLTKSKDREVKKELIVALSKCKIASVMRNVLTTRLEIAGNNVDEINRIIDESKDFIESDNRTCISLGAEVGVDGQREFYRKFFRSKNSVQKFYSIVGYVLLEKAGLP